MLVRSFALKALYGAVCVAAASTLAVSHFAGKYIGYINKTGQDGFNIASSPPKPTQAMNILLMGLESRTNFYGQELPPDLLAAMHAGYQGGQETNTLILIHIFAGGKKAVGISIPRDDQVTYPQAYYEGQSAGKIDNVYNSAYNLSLQQTGSSTNNDYTIANQQGQKATIDEVQDLTGVHIDDFAEVNLDGFYELAKAFHGIEACVKALPGDTNLYDKASGWNAVKSGYNLRKGGTQYLHLAADQALAFVRDRDSLPQYDLDRTKRQQSVIDYVVYELEHENILSSLSDLNSLLSTASQYLKTNPSFNLLEFTSDMRALTGRNITFFTAPISGETDDQYGDVNLIDPSYVKEYVQEKFGLIGSPGSSPAATRYPLSDTTVDVYNAGAVSGTARNVEDGLVHAGFTEGMVGNAATQSGTSVLYGSGAAAAANAAKIAKLFGVTAAASGSVSAGAVEVVVGPDSTIPTSYSSLSGSTSDSSGTSSSSDTSNSSSTSSGNDGQSGGAVTVGKDAPYGIPCVY